VDLRRLPLWLQYAIAIAVSAVVMYFAWLAGRDKPTPGWLPPLMSAWFYIGPGLIAFFVIRCLWRRLGR
jgi:hypothetical protein